jgi:hypothetical protein
MHPAEQAISAKDFSDISALLGVTKIQEFFETFGLRASCELTKILSSKI